MKTGRKMLNTDSAATIGLQEQSGVVPTGDYQSRLLAEKARIEKIKNDATPPVECGWLIPTAPARGGFVRFMPMALEDNGKGEMVNAPAGHAGRHALRAADAFDQMIAAADRAKKTWPLTPGQIAIGRRYRDLVEWRAAGGIKCSSINGRVSGSGERDFMDAYLSAGRELESMHRRIGRGVAMEVRRVRPSSRGKAGAKPILDRSLIDMVCIRQMQLADVLTAHGWSTKGQHRIALRDALCNALDRMIGYRGEKSS